MSSISKFWDVLPAEDFTVQSKWRRNGDRYSAIRARLLIIRHELDEYRDGNIKESHPISVDSISLETARQTVYVRTDTMTAGLRYAVSQRVLDQLSSKVSSQLEAKVPGYSGKLGAELLSKEEYEVTQTAEESFSGTTSFSITESEEKKHTITLNPGTAREAALRRRYWPRRWDVYLHSYEALEFEYKKRWFWHDVRKTMKIAEPQIIGWPLFSMNYYEPQTNLVVTYGAIANELTEPDAITISELTDPMPKGPAPALESLSDRAKLAFPVTKEERAISTQYSQGRKRTAAGSGAEGRRFGIVGRPAPKGFSVKKAAKKAVAKKAVKKAAAKKTAKKAAKKAAPKRAAKKTFRGF